MTYLSIRWVILATCVGIPVYRLTSHTPTHMQGCLKPVQVLIPSGSLLDPSETAAVVGGNVLTCQRIVDVVFRAFETCAASQGCMNNVTFGDANVGYYETVAGGAGAVSGCGWGYWTLIASIACCVFFINVQVRLQAHRHIHAMIMSILIYMYDCVNCCCRVQDGTGAAVFTVT